MAEYRYGVNDLGTWCENNGERGQRILDEWDYEKNFNSGNALEPSNYTYGSNVEIWWKCRDCGHSWKIRIASRTVHGKGCTECAKQRRIQKRREKFKEEGKTLWSWCQDNGERGQRLINEWDEKKNLEEGRTMESIPLYYSEKCHWICSMCGEPFLQSPVSRVRHNCNCSRCVRSGTSYPEKMIFYSLKQVYSSTRNREKLFENIEYDIVVPELNLCIEYNGEYWHREKKERDEMKRKLAIANGYKFIDICEGEKCDEIEYLEGRIKIPKAKSKILIDALREVVCYIVNMHDGNIEDINFIKADEEARSLMIKNGKGLLEHYPQLIDEWADERNPEYYTCGSYVRVHWKCKNCGNEWDREIYNRTSKQSGCSKCRFNIFKGKIIKPNRLSKEYRKKHPVINSMYFI